MAAATQKDIKKHRQPAPEWAIKAGWKPPA